MILTVAVSAEDYQFLPLEEGLAKVPWHKTFILDGARTSPDHLNAGSSQCHFFLERCFKNTLQKASPQKPWEEFEGFLSWAVWGYLSQDSRYRGDERLIEMSQVWLDRMASKAKEDEKFRLGTWSFHYYSIPLLEIEARPDLVEKIGKARVESFHELAMKTVLENTVPAAYNDLLRRSENYVNIATHPMAVYIHGWLLTEEEKYLKMASRIVHILARDQMPNGMFPYRIKIHGERHLEYEAMYYHAINLRGLYLYWWATGSKLAEEVFRKSVPYYPLNLEPPYFFNDGPDIWWKDQWRTFWPHQIAMVAAVARDGENATIARAMAKDNISHDRTDVFLGAHAYQQLAMRKVESQPQRTNYLIDDPDIRGVRLRFGRWSSTFTAGTFTYTRTSAMCVAENRKSYSALHMARPYIRVHPLDRPWKTEPDYGTLGSEGTDYFTAKFAGADAAKVTNVCAVATTYSPALTSHTWRPKQPIAPWKMSELWFMTDSGMVGMIVSEAMADNEARELCHQFRFITTSLKEENGWWLADSLRLKVWETDLSNTIPERMRRYAMGIHDRKDWQVALSDRERSPENVAQNPQPAVGEDDVEVLLPEMETYAKGFKRFSLVEVGPQTGTNFESVVTKNQPGLVSFEVSRIGMKHLVAYNHSPKPVEWSIPKGARVGTSWTLVGTPQTFSIPSNGVVLVRLAK